jgi:predicted protein tyrosine phosphatase
MTLPVKTKLHVLFVCSLNQWRSPTAEELYRNDERLDVRSAGLRSTAKRYLSEADVTWADIIFVMDHEQKAWVQERFRHLKLPRIHSLDIPDTLVYMDPELQGLLRAGIDPELAVLLTS